MISLHPTWLLLASWLLPATIMFFTWRFAKKRDRAAWVDVAWSFNFILIALIVISLAPGDFPSRLLAGGMMLIWSARLTGSLWHRLAKDREEDGRYITLKDKWKAQYGSPWGKLLGFFQMQALSNALLAIPLIIVTSQDRPGISAWEWAGAALILLSIAGTWLSDHQLAQFRHNPSHKGKTCRQGLWGYSRHPNYFFEWLHWVGYGIMAIGLAYWWLAWSSALLMLLFITKVTGIPPTEAQALKSRGDDYRRYQKETSAFIPWFPKRPKHNT